MIKRFLSAATVCLPLLSMNTHSGLLVEDTYQLDFTATTTGTAVGIYDPSLPPILGSELSGSITFSYNSMNEIPGRKSYIGEVTDIQLNFAGENITFNLGGSEENRANYFDYDKFFGDNLDIQVGNFTPSSPEDKLASVDYKGLDYFVYFDLDMKANLDVELFDELKTGSSIDYLADRPGIFAFGLVTDPFDFSKVGTYSYQIDTIEVAVVPEPSSVTMLLTGLLGGLLIRRRTAK